MKCDIHYIQNNEGVPYWCLAHKTKGTEVDGNAPTICDCKYKERYENIVKMNSREIENIKIVYSNLNKNSNVSLFINGEEFKGILKLENSIIDLKDYGGLMLSKLNNIHLEASKCPLCGGMHTDNGMFAYTPHSKHLCIYCGHFYKVEEANIGNELALYFDFPNISLEDNVVDIEEKCEITYDLFKGEVLINKESCNKVKRNNEEIDLVSFLNEKLKEEY